MKLSRRIFLKWLSWAPMVAMLGRFGIRRPKQVFYTYEIGAVRMDDRTVQIRVFTEANPFHPESGDVEFEQ